MQKDRDADGNDVYLEINAAPILDAAGNVVQIVEVRRDVTAHMRTEVTPPGSIPRGTRGG